MSGGRTGDAGTSEVLARVRAGFPTLTWESTTVPPQGMDHEVVVLHGASGSGADPVDLVARLPRTQAYREQAPVEAGVLELLSRTADSPVRLPHPALTTADGRVTLQGRIAGEPLDAQVWKTLDPERQDAVTRQLAGMMRLLHGSDVASSPVSDVVSWWTADGTVNTASPRALPAKAALVRTRAAELLPARISAEDLGIVESILHDVDVMLSSRLSASDGRLIHSDLYDSHLLWDGSSLGVIDFSDMNIGDPALDYAHLFALDPALPRRVAEQSGDAEDDAALLHRAWTYARWDAVFLLLDHLRTGHTPASVAWEVFGRAKAATAPPL
ncbi:MAG TPA: aminoglycoside phosphotransferase family protein [Candidatus Corynebacterium avicola]|uniref:Aminoglycoside phosphotransferase family protein n=1 Tax=Candidatus Corynebacterium avicola TaxID=2838527 RepID=A0A9D1RN01_9CORY|nr:aminoglycoside phosphotransferase family protein [Candidatus Corynebacterium avicola]